MVFRDLVSLAKLIRSAELMFHDPVLLKELV